MVWVSLELRRANISPRYSVPLFSKEERDMKGDMKAQFVAATLTMFFYGLAFAIFML